MQERIETYRKALRERNSWQVQRGASAFLNGMAPGGNNIGGTVSVLPKRVLGYLGFLGLKADHEANLKARFGNAGVITTADSAAVAVVIPTNEELMIAHDTARLSGL